ncbi:adenylosuccinate synthetase isozyme 2 A-like [Symsagittifera roscoffensis]|uniref:adenylosuccinate synthetase isozyme 2 A-like n=1 Tax=Symsagittifera roscoffensis TaxID=84072 RepID=UPI00307BD8C7
MSQNGLLSSPPPSDITPAMTHQQGDHKRNQAVVVLGAQWGDEGKGKLIDLLADQFDVVCRCQGGNNAGHTVVAKGVEYDFHLLPSGIIQPNTYNILGNGVVIHLPGLFSEINNNITNEDKVKLMDRWEERLLISTRAHLVFDVHQRADGLYEAFRKLDKKGGGSLGTTRRGIGPAYSTKALRLGVRVCDLIADDFSKFEGKFRLIVNYYTQLFEEIAQEYTEEKIQQELKRYQDFKGKLERLSCDVIPFMHEKLSSNKKILIEGANALFLDIDFGTYPFVTSSNCSIGGVCTGLGIPPSSIGDVFGVVKAYTTRVGEGPFPTELLDSTGSHLQNKGREFGVTTGRPRRCGWLDCMLLKYSCMINGFTALALTKLDILDELETIKVGVGYMYRGKKLNSVPADLDILKEVTVEYVEMPGWKCDISQVRSYSELPENAKKYISTVESILGDGGSHIRFRWIGVGKSREAIINITV